MIGKRLAHYEITEKLGEGGMGQVYQATDTKLDRQVALKVLPQAFSSDAQRMARFEREAKMLASLNHPSIAAIYGVEEAGGIRALALEFVPGETLEERIRRGPVPVPETLEIALQICEALEIAHEKGITHRDLKPANVKITPEGRVKVLDFGLAKATRMSSSEELANSPTLTMQATQAGLILGTAAYMSPEQARGEDVDSRTDVWAFGATLFHLLTGALPFTGKSISDMLAGVLEREPDWSKLPPLPPRLDQLLRLSLRKDRRLRLQSIADARIAILDALEEPEAALQSAPGRLQRRFSAGPRIVTVLVLTVVAFALGFWLGRPSSGGQELSDLVEPTKTEINLPETAPVAFGITHAFDPVLITLSPDGQELVYVGQREDGRSQLFQRSLRSLDVNPIPGTEGAMHPFFSPDGNWVGFTTQDRIRKVSLRGGGVITVCSASLATRASWTRDGKIYFGPLEGRSLWVVDAGGGEAQEAFDLSRVPGYLNQVLPDGRAALVSTMTLSMTPSISGDFANIYVIPLDTLEPRVLIEGGYDAHYLPSGHLVFGRTGSLMAVAFDPDRLEIAGEPVPVLEDVRMESLFSNVQLAVSDDGLVVYSPGRDAAVGSIARVARDGSAEFLEMPERVYGVFDLSADGTQLAIHVADAQDYVWIYDLERREGRRQISQGSNGWPSLSPDGRRIASVVTTGDERFVQIRELGGGSEPPHQLRNAQFTGGWMPDGSGLAVENLDGIGIVSEASGWELEMVVERRSLMTGMGTISPDGNWIAYVSDETGQWEIWIQSLTENATPYQVSTNGGIEPVWSASGELFFHLGNRWFVTRLSPGSATGWEPPQLAFQTEYIDTPGVSFDVSPEGKYLYVVKSSRPIPRTRFQVIENWFEELNRLVPIPQ